MRPGAWRRAAGGLSPETATDEEEKRDR